MTAIPERFRLARETISAGQQDRILEIGCGTGILIRELSEDIETGQIVGIDRSETAIAKAEKNNREKTASGAVALICQDLKDSRFPEAHFDKVIAFNVNLFLKNSAAEFSLIANTLKPGGELFVFYQFPYEVSHSAADPIAGHLARNGFGIAAKELIATNSTSVVFVKAIR
jgi:SAM-dependent methyltransferase